MATKYIIISKKTIYLEKVKAVKVKLQCRNDLDKPTRYLTVMLKNDKYKIRGLHTDSDDSC